MLPVTKATMRMLDAKGQKLIRKPGTRVVDLVASATPLIGSGGRISAVIFTVTDVTELKRTMLALEVTEKRTVWVCRWWPKA